MALLCLVRSELVLALVFGAVACQNVCFSLVFFCVFSFRRKFYELTFFFFLFSISVVDNLCKFLFFNSRRVRRFFECHLLFFKKKISRVVIFMFFFFFFFFFDLDISIFFCLG